MRKNSTGAALAGTLILLASGCGSNDAGEVANLTADPISVQVSSISPSRALDAKRAAPLPGNLSTTDPESIWVLVNKKNPLEPAFEPSDLVMPDIPRTGNNQQLRAEAAAALEKMSAAAENEIGQPLQMVSGYRTYKYQDTLYRNYVAKDGQLAADTYSARPGHSEHQTGLAADLTTVGGTMSGFGDSALGKWTADNSWKYGFILRYTPENIGITGYQSEPWHFRYVGTDLARQYHDSGAIALENLLGAPAASDY